MELGRGVGFKVGCVGSWLGEGVGGLTGAVVGTFEGRFVVGPCVGRRLGSGVGVRETEGPGEINK